MFVYFSVDFFFILVYVIGAIFMCVRYLPMCNKQQLLTIIIMLSPCACFYCLRLPRRDETVLNSTRNNENLHIQQ